MDLNEIFTYHAPGPGDPEKYEAIRTAGKALAQAILDNCPPCADRSAAIRKVRESVMVANASVALKGLV